MRGHYRPHHILDHQSRQSKCLGMDAKVPLKFDTEIYHSTKKSQHTHRCLNTIERTFHSIHQLDRLADLLKDFTQNIFRTPDGCYFAQ